MEETSNSLSPPATSQQIRSAVLGFLQERLQPKLDELKEEDDEQRQQLLATYLPENWIPDAARRVCQIQQVTHALKFTHPDAKGSSLSMAGNPEAGELQVGTHSIRDQLASDVVGNAAALDVYKFLRLSVGGKSLLDYACKQDPALAAALSNDAEQASIWMAAFSTLAQAKGQPASHKLAKQIYWPLGKGEYHLLAPLFPTSLVHGVWKTIREDRFSETAKAAREARRAGIPHPQGYREYPNVAIQNFGGTKPQNISQLNSERHGENFLLPSLPPTWHSEAIRPLFHMDSVFDRLFGNRSEVKRLTKELRDFLVSVEEANSSLRIRNKRAELVGYICDELLQFAAELHELESGWSLDPECRLNPEEQCWLDPERRKVDEAFAAQRCRSDWQESICRRFGNWLNARLNTEKTPMGEAEAQHWQTVLDKELGMIRMELDFND